MDDDIDDKAEKGDSTWNYPIVYDTIYKDSIIYDTIIVDSVVHDTVTFDSIIHDTIIVDSIIYDTIIIEHGLEKIRVAQWNLGHFALGSSYNTKITQAKAATMQAKWTDAIRSINADLFCCCEYNTNFVDADKEHDAITAWEAIFPQYQFGYIGSKPNTKSYVQTAIFSRFPIRNVKQHVYKHTVQAGRYFQYGELNMSGKTVIIVATHLDFNQGENGAAYREDQIHELMDFFASAPYVIICADWNSDITNYSIIEERDYAIANYDVNTYPSGKSPQWPLDNIICKGFEISSVGYVNDATLTDHIAVFTDLSIINQ